MFLKRAFFPKGLRLPLSDVTYPGNIYPGLLLVQTAKDFE